MAHHSAGGSGVYFLASGVLKVEADNNTVVPGTTDTFQTFFGVSVDGNEIAFVGRDFGNATALYAGTNPGNLRPAAGRTAQVPGEVFNFSGLVESTRI